MIRLSVCVVTALASICSLSQSSSAWEIVSTGSSPTAPTYDHDGDPNTPKTWDRTEWIVGGGLTYYQKLTSSSTVAELTATGSYVGDSDSGNYGPGQAINKEKINNVAPYCPSGEDFNVCVKITTAIHLKGEAGDGAIGYAARAKSHATIDCSYDTSIEGYDSQTAGDKEGDVLAVEDSDFTISLTGIEYTSGSGDVYDEESGPNGIDRTEEGEGPGTFATINHAITSAKAYCENWGLEAYTKASTSASAEIAEK